MNTNELRKMYEELPRGVLDYKPSLYDLFVSYSSVECYDDYLDSGWVVGQDCYDYLCYDLHKVLILPYNDYTRQGGVFNQADYYYRWLVEKSPWKDCYLNPSFEHVKKNHFWMNTCQPWDILWRAMLMVRQVRERWSNGMPNNYKNKVEKDDQWLAAIYEDDRCVYYHGTILSTCNIPITVWCNPTEHRDVSGPPAYEQVMRDRDPNMRSKVGSSSYIDKGSTRTQVNDMLREVGLE